MTPGNTTHLILGGIDKNGIKDGETIKYMMTKDSSSWALQFDKISMFDQ